MKEKRKIELMQKYGIKFVGGSAYQEGFFDCLEMIDAKKKNYKGKCKDGKKHYFTDKEGNRVEECVRCGCHISEKKCYNYHKKLGRVIKLVKCYYCEKNIKTENIAVFDAINGNACDDCYEKYESDKKNNLLNSPFDDKEMIKYKQKKRKSNHKSEEKQ